MMSMSARVCCLCWRSSALLHVAAASPALRVPWTSAPCRPFATRVPRQSWTESSNQSPMHLMEPPAEFREEDAPPHLLDAQEELRVNTGAPVASFFGHMHYSEVLASLETPCAHTPVQVAAAICHLGKQCRPVAGSKVPDQARSQQVLASPAFQARLRELVLESGGRGRSALWELRPRDCVNLLAGLRALGLREAPVLRALLEHLAHEHVSAHLQIQEACSVLACLAGLRKEKLHRKLWIGKTRGRQQAGLMERLVRMAVQETTHLSPRELMTVVKSCALLIYHKADGPCWAAGEVLVSGDARWLIESLAAAVTQKVRLLDLQSLETCLVCLEKLGADRSELEKALQPQLRENVEFKRMSLKELLDVLWKEQQAPELSSQQLVAALFHLARKLSSQEPTPASSPPTSPDGTLSFSSFLRRPCQDVRVQYALRRLLDSDGIGLQALRTDAQVQLLSVVGLLGLRQEPVLLATLSGALCPAMANMGVKQISLVAEALCNLEFYEPGLVRGLTAAVRLRLQEASQDERRSLVVNVLHLLDHAEHRDEVT
eukprot:g45572.t1